MFGVYSVDYAIVLGISVGILQHVLNKDKHFTIVMSTKKSNIHLNSVETV